MIQTSRTAPIEVSWISILRDHDLGLTFAPGRKGLSSYGFEWRRSLGTDLTAIRRAGAGVLVCLLERHEIDYYIGSGYEEAVRAHGLVLVHAPIRDVSVPSVRFGRSLVRTIGHELARARRVVVHCLGGLGRTGTVAGIVAKSFGASTSDTFAMLQYARGVRCPETSAQRAMVASWRPAQEKRQHLLDEALRTQ